jgi:hypothetical protein
VIAYGEPATELDAVAVVEQVGWVVRSPASSPFWNPVITNVSAGFAEPYARVLLSAVTVRPADVTVSTPATAVNE